ncbi:methionyl-tRNA formyltransferase [Alteromonas sp. a30]|uniref:methionyl-tRNA formyltransferase n=1 Tax=Alteromonas sp. a30 TaxID=2730917 RepID=UPI00228197B6|nr:formyltransferase family protein [Alteromonas sp. a30]MCY7295059.1 hypothetical protein [Alteromonas sp. a30]
MQTQPEQHSQAFKQKRTSEDRGYNVILVSTFVEQFNALLKGLENSTHQCVAVITREGGEAVADAAKESNLPVFSFPNCANLQRLMDKDAAVAAQVHDAMQVIEALDPDILCCWGYQILPECLIQLPKVNALNFHFADLPKYRGGMSLAAQIIEGEPETRLSLHELTVEVDAGMIMAKSEPIALPGLSSQAILQKGINVAGKMLVDTLDQMLSNTLTPMPNDYQQPGLPHSWGVLRENITLEDGTTKRVNKGYLGYLAIHWDEDSCKHIERACLGFDKLGGPYSCRDTLLVHFLNATQVNSLVTHQPGTILEVTDENSILVQAQDGQLRCQIFLNPQISKEENPTLQTGDKLSKVISVSQLTGINDADR